jgi:GNAT superfamily N-acetyltransferase
MTIREACPGDAAALARLSTQLGYPTTADQMSRRATEVFRRPGNAVFVAEVDGEVVAWIHVVEIVTLESDPSVEIAGLIVDESHRGVGIGARLVAEVELWTRSEGYGILQVRSNVIRDRARRFYEREGFTLKKSQNHFVKSLAGRGGTS